MWKRSIFFVITKLWGITADMFLHENRHDYENITSALLFKPVDYSTAVQVLEEVLKENIF